MHFKNTYRLYLALAIMIGIYSCEQETIRLDSYEIHGIDVSRYQGKVNWNKVIAQDIDFIFMKATEGETLVDSQFHSNWKQLSDLNIRKGAYHFFRPTVSSITQARHFTKTVKMDFGDLPPVLDIELMDGVSKAKLVNSLKSWISIVESHYNVKPIIYTNQKFYNQNLAGHFDDYLLWIARYNNNAEPDLKGKNKWSFWQYGNRGRIDGIHGDVDFNVFKGSALELDNMTSQPPTVLSFN